MSGSFGAIELPASATVDLDSVGDPALGHLVAFLSVWLNSQLREIWAKLAPGDADIVRHAFTHDPAELCFNQNDLPALYASRGDTVLAPDDWWGEDFEAQQSSVKLLWVPPPGAPELLRKRANIYSAVAASVKMAFIEEQTPDYLDGANINELMGAHCIRVTRWRPSAILIPVSGGSPMRYRCLEMQVTIIESAVRDLDPYPLATANDLTAIPGVSIQVNNA